MTYILYESKMLLIDLKIKKNGYFDFEKTRKNLFFIN